ncbi:MAG: Holliday junction branch migration protein RuvA [Gammaproteobacteria bacterium]
MIGLLRGRVLDKRPPHLLLEVAGVGYELEAPMSTFYKLPEAGVEVVLHTHLIPREDALNLYGFATERERRLFRALIRVNGVGARIGLAILSGIDADEFAACVEAGDTARMTRVPGIGKKTAERLIIEMRDRLADWHTGGAIRADLPARAAQAPDPVADAVAGLVALGYKPQEASRYVHAIDATGLTSEALIREALKSLARAK